MEVLTEISKNTTLITEIEEIRNLLKLLGLTQLRYLILPSRWVILIIFIDFH